MRKSACTLLLLASSAVANLFGQLPASLGTYSQNFDALGSSNANWTNNLTLPGWCASKGNSDATNFTAGSGTSQSGSIYSFGVAGVNTATDRALGSVAASSTTYAYAVRFTNNTASAQSNILISYTGEQWRSGSSAVTQTLAFSFQLSPSSITNSFSGNWTNFSALNFVSPNLSAASTALDGNAATNRQIFSNVALAGVTLPSGYELALRWSDADDSGFDDALGIDDVTVIFNGGLTTPPFILTQPVSQTATQNDNVIFSVVAGGSVPLAYQWRFNGADITGETNQTLVLNSVAVNQGGNYSVIVSNAIGIVNSSIASLTVYPAVLPTPGVRAFSLMDYNTHGNFVSDWTTNSLHVQAIGRQVMFLDPDIITFQEIPMTNSGWAHMGEFTAVYRPGFYLATNSGTDGFIRSAILSRFPIIRSTSWLDGASLVPFGYTNVPPIFTRDLFEAVVAVPGFPQPLHVFTTHLKSGSSSSVDAQRRAAEAGAISKFFVTGFLTTNSLEPYLLTGDMNEDILIPSTGSQQPIQRLTNGTGLQLTTPANPFTSDSRTFSIQDSGGLTKRYDYILPNNLLAANIATGMVFRSDLLSPVPPNLNSNDDKVASDHLPLFMVFNNPYDKPFRLLSISKSNATVELAWESVAGQNYRVESSQNLSNWTAFATGLIATNGRFVFSTNAAGSLNHFRVYRVPAGRHRAC